MMMMAVVQQYFAPSRLASFYTVKLKKLPSSAKVRLFSIFLSNAHFKMTTSSIN